MKRNSNIELLRILSMLLIVAGHFSGQGKLYELDLTSVDNIVLHIFGTGQRIAVNIFLLISVYYLVDKEVDARRIMKIWGEVFFYTFIITFTMYICGFHVTKKQLIQSIMPYLGRPLWFASAYISLLLVSPFLRKAFEMKKEDLKKLVCTMGIIVMVLPTFADEMDTYLCSIIWFVFVYIFVGYCKKYITIKLKGSYCIVAGVCLYVMLMLVPTVGGGIGINKYLQLMSVRFIHDFKSIPNFAIAVLIFYGFVSLRYRCNKIVNVFASGTFAVYIIHQTPAFYPVLWHTILQVWEYMPNGYIFIKFLASVLIVFVLFSVIDSVRRNILEPAIMKCKITNELIEYMNRFIVVNKGV